MQHNNAIPWDLKALKNNKNENIFVLKAFKFSHGSDYLSK